MSVSEYIKVASGNHNELGIQGYKMITPIVPNFEKKLGFTTCKVDR